MTTKPRTIQEHSERANQFYFNLANMGNQASRTRLFVETFLAALKDADYRHRLTDKSVSDLDGIFFTMTTIEDAEASYRSE